MIPCREPDVLNTRRRSLPVLSPTGQVSRLTGGKGRGEGVDRENVTSPLKKNVTKSFAWDVMTTACARRSVCGKYMYF